MEAFVETLLVALGMMAGVVGVSVALVQLMHWSESKRAQLMRQIMTQAYNDGYHAGRNREE